MSKPKYNIGDKLKYSGTNPRLQEFAEKHGGFVTVRLVGVNQYCSVCIKTGCSTGYRFVDDYDLIKTLNMTEPTLFCFVESYTEKIGVTIHKPQPFTQR